MKHGSGGRVAVYQTKATDFSAFTGKIIANGGRHTGSGNLPSRAPGTVDYAKDGSTILWGGGGLRVIVR